MQKIIFGAAILTLSNAVSINDMPEPAAVLAVTGKALKALNITPKEARDFVATLPMLPADCDAIDIKVEDADFAKLEADLIKVEGKVKAVAKANNVSWKDVEKFAMANIGAEDRKFVMGAWKEHGARIQAKINGTQEITQLDVDNFVKIAKKACK